VAWAAALDRLTETIRDQFPSAAVHTPDGGSPDAHTCVHDYKWVNITVNGEVTQAGMMHVAFVRLADLAATPAQGDAYAIGSDSFQVLEVRPDGSGAAELILHRA